MKSNQIHHLQKIKSSCLSNFSCLWVKPSSPSSIPMAPNQKISQQKRPKTNAFLSCFGFSSKKKPKKGGPGKKFKLFKLNWPKIKVITTINKRDMIFDPKSAALKASHNIMLEATKVHQHCKLIDHQTTKTQEPMLTIKRITNQQEDKESYPKTESTYCDTCHKKDSSAPKAVKQCILTKKVTKDSIIGVSIMLSMLIILLIWGRMCAILCMSAWLYCLPLLRPINRAVIIPDHTEKKLVIINRSDSEMHNKKIVLQGLLQRDHKSAFAIS
ncbi:unnamed protein product [Amaranthus hypochondriacus]